VKTSNWPAWLTQYVVPLLILIASLPLILLLVYLTGADLYILWVFVVLPVLSFLTALVLRPAHAWVVPAVMVVLLLIVYSVSWYALGHGPAQQANLLVLVLILVIPVGGSLTVMTWAGRALGQAARHHATRGNGPQAPAT